MAVTCPSCSERLPDLGSMRFCPGCGAPVPAADPLVDQVLAGRYRILGVVGEGGMGRVYLAEQMLVSTARRVALKILLPELADDERIAARFLDEIGLVAGLEHPNTVRVLDAGRAEGGRVYVAMELLQGQPLSRVMGAGPLEPSRIERIVAQICGSLTEAHGKGIVHRDLKPDNVMLCSVAGETDVVKVLDFGIARLHGGGEGREVDGGPRPRITRRGEVLGTPEYMAPERFGSAEGDPRSDIYSLGVVMYEMACGRLPFDGRGLAQWAMLHGGAAPAPFEATPAGAALPTSLKRTIARALSKRPEDRPQSARELLAELTLVVDPPPWTSRASARPSATVAAEPLGASDTLGDASRRPSGTVVGPADGGWPAANILPTPSHGIAPPPRSSAVAAVAGRRAWVFVLGGAVLGALVLAAVLLVTHDEHPHARAPRTAATESAPLAQGTTTGPVATSASPPPPTSASPAAIDWCARALEAASRKHCAVAEEARRTCPVGDSRGDAARRLCAPASGHAEHGEDPCAEALSAAMAGRCAVARGRRRHCPESDSRHEVTHGLCP